MRSTSERQSNAGDKLPRTQRIKPSSYRMNATLFAVSFSALLDRALLRHERQQITSACFVAQRQAVLTPGITRRAHM